MSRPPCFVPGVVVDRAGRGAVCCHPPCFEKLECCCCGGGGTTRVPAARLLLLLALACEEAFLFAFFCSELVCFAVFALALPAWGGPVESLGAEWSLAPGLAA